MCRIPASLAGSAPRLLHGVQDFSQFDGFSPGLLYVVQDFNQFGGFSPQIVVRRAGFLQV
ncbi:hypothetical protein JI735_19020 [Paenibacillus sonchi]|uniref:Uncharacterized protein n=1 Tax=Paenibacillus sonchi TaxID=373687 RepID=A0A974P7M2_9BACL|nr:hypothetical protein [Paenibacillus sonchi]QQZ58830.1 hypothetical protein JI735_19020 [Paenibacillus sonchi]